MRRVLQRFLLCLPALFFTAPAAAKHPPIFKGESCLRCHASIRDSSDVVIPKSAKEWRRRQVVVVGGGLAGLSAAHFLKDLDVLVLEKEDKPGGHARREFFSNGPYPVAAVYLDEPEGPIKELIEELKLKPNPIHAPAETLQYGKQYIHEWLSTGVEQFPMDVRPEMRKLSAALKKISEKNLVIPVPNSDKELHAQYEGITFWDYLEKNFGPTSAKMGDMFVKDMFGAGAKDVSALMGLLYIMDMITPSGASWPGGLGVVSEALAKKLGSRVATGAMVVSVSQSPQGATVEFMKDGRYQRVQADAVIFATHMLVTQRIAKDLSSEKMKAMKKIRYSSYITVPLSFSQKVWEHSYSLWNMDTIFTDITFAAQNNSRFPGTDKMPGQVAVAYLPMGAKHDEGRSFMMDNTDEEIIAKVKVDLEIMLPGSLAKLKDARVIRWGHAMPVMGPNYFRDIQPIIAKPEKRYFFAGEDTQVPALEGAVYSGFYAARDVRSLLLGPR